MGDCLDRARCSPKPEECGVVLGLENHWGLGGLPKECCESSRRSGRPGWGSRSIPATSSNDPYEQMRKMLDSKVPIALVQAKTYLGGGRWYYLISITAGLRGCCGNAAIWAGSPWSSREINDPKTGRARQSGLAQKALLVRGHQVSGGGASANSQNASRASSSAS